MKIELMLIAALAATDVPARADTPDQHQAIVTSHGAQVMPFDQKVAMHMFTPSATGGTLEIMVHNMDPRQISLVRGHLRDEVARFAVGDYSDPAYIHGKSMPGLQRMETSIIAVRYADTAMGGRIVFYGADSSAISAVHRWLSAQAKDHGTSHNHCDMKM